MKTIGIFVLLVLLIFSASSLYAAPVGSTATPAVIESSMISKHEKSVVGIMTGFESDVVNDRKLSNQQGKTDLRFYDGKIGLVFYDRVIVYALAGVGRFEGEFRDNQMDFKLESNTDLSWGVGGTVVLYELTLYDFDNSTLRLAIDGKYRGTKLEVDRVYLDTDTGTDVYELPDTRITGTEIEYSDWQIAGAVSWQWKRIIPYLGLKYSDTSGKVSTTISGTEYNEDIKSREKLGLFFGSDFIIKDPISETDAISVNIEYRLFDEEALSIGCAVRF